MSDLDEFKATYFDECSELLGELEEQFAAIEEGDRESDRMHAVFRAIHSIKGGAGAFGFQRLVEFAHSFETLLDYVRDGRVELSDDVVALCIRANDIVADFVAAARVEEDLGADFGAEEKAQFEALCNGDAEDEDDGPTQEDFDEIEFTPVMVDLEDEPASDSFDEAPLSDGAAADLAEIALETDKVDDAARGWRVEFTPLPALYERANDPLLLLRELAGLGTSTIEARLTELPLLHDFEPFGVYCSWVITLTDTSASEADIREVFEFVEGDCEIAIAAIDGSAAAASAPVAEAEEETSFADLAASLNAGAEMDEDAISEEPVSEDQAVEEASAANKSDGEPVAEDKPAAKSQPSFADLAGELGVTGLDAGDEDEDAADAAIAKTEAAAKPAAAPAPAAAGYTKPAATETRKPAMQSIRVDLDKVDRVVNMVGELVITQSMLNQQMDDTLRDKYQELVRGIEVLAQTTRGLQDSVMAIRAQPVKSVFSRMPRLVRELSAKTGKKIRLEMVGENTEIDKTVIEQLSDPLTHMIRNSADHGIETIEKRTDKGKPETGVIKLSAEQAGGSILIVVEDDGAGINRERVLEIARERGVVPPDTQLTEDQIDNLIFAPGFSTASEVSDISGRGVGMDVVLSNIKKIGGSVNVKSRPGFGTRMTLRLPLTLAVLDVMLVKVADCHYVIPLSSIVETIQTSRSDFGSVPSGSRLLKVRGEYVQVVDLADRFDMNSITDDEHRFVVLCEAEGGVKVALIVDDIVGQQQVVIKSLEENYESIDGIAGGTILGDGSVALIVDVQGIKASPTRQNAA
ncbi:chemotaxis protein CheA [Cucumibacter marinus]|uniref:chemotaxis protein CheA n=1 Tax=Cucumibacter marinus TaxID=1121252 RepID=UPI00042261F4|nr:chemotaxis protein CheA [Cucumibacter marinus]